MSRKTPFLDEHQFTCHGNAALERIAEDPRIGDVDQAAVVVDRDIVEERALLVAVGIAELLACDLFAGLQVPADQLLVARARGCAGDVSLVENPHDVIAVDLESQHRDNPRALLAQLENEDGDSAADSKIPLIPFCRKGPGQGIAGLSPRGACGGQIDSARPSFLNLPVP